jgi:hypothetical protein
LVSRKGSEQSKRILEASCWNWMIKSCIISFKMDTRYGIRVWIFRRRIWFLS